MFLIELNSDGGKICINVNQTTVIENLTGVNKTRINFNSKDYVVINEPYESVIRQIMEAK